MAAALLLVAGLTVAAAGTGTRQALAQRQADGTYKTVRLRIGAAAYAGAARKLANLNDIGLTPAGQARWQAARDQELEDVMSYPGD